MLHLEFLTSPKDLLDASSSNFSFRVAFFTPSMRGFTLFSLSTIFLSFFCSTALSAAGPVISAITSSTANVYRKFEIFFSVTPLFESV